jgi:glycosyltransferase involved in cell wall biosynthesis
MATELPVISTDVSGIPELVKDAQTGLVVNEKDEVDLADAMQRLLTDEALRLRLGKNGRQHVIQEFNIERNSEKLATIFRRYVETGDGSTTTSRRRSLQTFRQEES